MEAILSHAQFFLIRPQETLNATNAVDFEIQLTKALTRKTHSSILVDLEQVQFLDSAGLMALVSGLKLTQSLNQRLSLCSVSASLRMILELTQLDQVFEIFENATAFVEGTGLVEAKRPIQVCL